eukprot:gene1419-1761_t
MAEAAAGGLRSPGALGEQRSPADLEEELVCEDMCNIKLYIR